MSSEQHIPQTLVATSQPPNARIGDDWFDPSTNALYKLLVLNGTAVQWVQISTGASSVSSSALTSVPTLQQVTDAGASTTNSISVGGTTSTFGALPSYQSAAALTSSKVIVYDNVIGTQINLVGDGVAAGFRASRFSNDASGVTNGFLKYRGTYASPLAAASGDNTGALNFQAYGGASTYITSSIQGNVETYTADNNLSGNLIFYTRPDGVGAVTAIRMTIGSTGIVTVSSTVTSVSTQSGALVVSGGVGVGGNIYSGGNIVVGSGSTGTTATITTPQTELTLGQTGDLFGPTYLRMQNRTGQNGPLFDASSSTVALVDFGFKTANAQRNIRFETRGVGFSYITGGDGYEFQIGSAASPTLVTNNIQVLVNTTTTSISTATGALVVGGGAGIGGSLFVGGIVSATNITLKNSSAGITNLFTSTVAPTVDQLTISNVGFPAVTAGVSSLQINYVGGAAAVEASASRIDLTPGTTTGGTWNGFRTVVDTDATTGVTLNGLKLDTIATPGAGTSNAIYVGTGWDSILNYNGTVVISGTNGAIHTGTVISGFQSSVSTNTGALQVSGGIGVNGSVYTGTRIGWTSATNVSAVYQIFNSANNSLDTVFG